MFGRRKEDNDCIALVVDDTERRIIVRALADLRDTQRMEHKNHDFLDTLIVKVCDAPTSQARSSYERS